MTDLSNYKRAWMITDTHLGVRNSSTEWLEIMKEYFYDFFIPLLKREKKPGDFLVHVGDVFDSRHSLNLLVMNEGINIFEEISKVMPIVIILGNHDIYKKNTNDVNSVKVLKWIPNIKVLEEPEVMKISGKKLLFMPWRATHFDESECIANNPADFLFCHTDVQGLKFNKNTVIESGLDLQELKAFRKIYAGHIHFAQNKGNFRMLGCPYPMTRSDINNEKGVWCLDIETEEELYYPNTISPKFIRILFEKVLEMEEDEAKEYFRNNFVDILVDPKWSLNFPFSVFADDMKGYRRLDFVPRMANVEDEDGMLLESEDADMEQIDIIELSQRLIYNTQHSDKLKENLLNTIKSLYERVQKSQNEKED
jgi:DNA repair exonuclease SbcCD nuclease subunit